MKILEELYYGNLSGTEEFMEPNSELARAVAETAKARIEVSKFLPRENDKKLEEFISVLDKQSVTEAKMAFIKGFKIGSLLMMELLQKLFEVNNIDWLAANCQ